MLQKPEDSRFPLFAGSSTGVFLSRLFLAGGSPRWGGIFEKPSGFLTIGDVLRSSD
jgi:hypothetical protein